jgi:hypothetical protein
MAGCFRVVAGVPVAGAGNAPHSSAGDSSSPRFPVSGPIRPGECMSAIRFTVVECTQPHELEVYRFTPLPTNFPAGYPTPAGLLPRFEPQCRAELAGYVGSPDVDASRLREFVFWPSVAGWTAGERWVLCAVVEIDPDDRPLRRTGALRDALRDGLGQFQSCSQGPPSEGALRVVPCREPHQGEAVPGVLVLGAPTDPAPTTEQTNAAAEPHCRRSIDAFLGTPRGPHQVRYSWRYPLPESWSKGYTAVVCYAETATSATGSLRVR